MNENKWRLVIAEEREVDAEVLSIYNYKPGDIVYIWDAHTLNICYERVPGRKMFYEVYMDQQGYDIDWLRHLSEKSWATCAMIKGLASAARRILEIRCASRYEIERWSEQLADAACEYIENRDY